MNCPPIARPTTVFGSRATRFMTRSENRFVRARSSRSSMCASKPKSEFQSQIANRKSQISQLVVITLHRVLPELEVLQIDGRPARHARERILRQPHVQARRIAHH